MTRRLWNPLIAVMWLALPAMALRYWQVWDRLPARMATHFDAAGRANGWMSRETSLAFTLGFMAFMLAVFSVVLYFVRRKYPPSAMSWALLIFFCAEMWTVFYILDSTLGYNLAGTPISVVPLLVVTPLGILVVLAVAFGEKRGTAFPSGDVLAQEVHSGKAWSPLLLIPMLAAGWVVLSLPTGAMRLGVVILTPVFLATFGMAWDGFHYYFTRHGLEIRTLGFRLKSVPAAQIEHYAVEKWNPVGGYGIRGTGNHKAYVWGNKGVRIRLQDGELFLGHSDPARIIRDLDFMKQSQPTAGVRGGGPG
jgi:hypothetical protein